jgi:hypothetical protein
MFTVALEPVFEASVGHLALGAGLAAAAHLVLRAMHRSRLADHVQRIDADEDEEEFPLRLGLRY